MKKIMLLVLITLFLTTTVYAEDGLLLHCNFDDSTTCEDGETPLQATGITFEQGYLNQGIRIDTGDILSYPSIGNFDKEKGTIMMWVKTDWSGGDISEVRYMFSYVDNGYATDAFRLRKGDNPASGNDWLGLLYYESGGPDHGVTYNLDSLKWQPDTWYHLAATWDATIGSLKIYLNGIEVSETDYSLGLPFNLDQMIGNEILIGTSYEYNLGSDNPEWRLQGVMDELKVYDVVLSDTEIMADANVSNSSIGDNSPPVIHDVWFVENEITAGESYHICSNITDESGIVEVLYWVQHSNGAYDRAYVYSGTNNTYCGTFETLEDASLLYIKLYAMRVIDGIGIRTTLNLDLKLNVTMDQDKDGIYDNIDVCKDTPLEESVNNDGCSCSQIVISYRECSEDICEDEYWVTYPLSGYDVCEAGEIILQYSCEPLTSEYDASCDIDDDNDGILDDNDKCSETPFGEITNEDGCSCSQLIGYPDFEDGNTCTIASCNEGIITYSNNELYSIPVDCPSDLCNGENWEDWTEDGNTICEEQELLEYNCNVISTYDVDCDSDDDNDGVLDDDDKCSDTIEDQIVYGCSCEQILKFKPGKVNSNICSKGIIKVFTKRIGWATDLFI